MLLAGFFWTRFGIHVLYAETAHVSFGYFSTLCPSASLDICERCYLHVWTPYSCNKFDVLCAE